MNSLLSRVRQTAPAEPWQSIPQPVPLLNVVAQPITPGSSSIRYVSTGITQEAEALLSQLPAPLYICAFAGFGRSGKSYTASLMRYHITGNKDYKFVSAPGNVPITHGIDMMVFENPNGPGHVVFLDCEGGANHNQTALPFVIGLAARLAARIYVFERGCFTTAGLDTVMQVINMGHATTTGKPTNITQSVVLVENMTINGEIPNEDLLNDLLNEVDGDETTNRVRSLIKQKFSLEFNKLPFDMGENQVIHAEICKEMSGILLENLIPFEVGGLDGDGPLVVQMVNELISQIRGGGNRFNMITATEALVSNMASEASNTVWVEFVAKVRKAGNHPVQVTGRKHLRTIMREVEGIATASQNELEGFIARLEPAEAAVIGRQIWERNYHNFQADLRAAYQRKADELAKYSQWTDRVNRWVREIVIQVMTAIRQFIRFARFSATLILMSNYYMWKNGINLVTSMASGAVQGVFA
ncbi:hypothetical protein HDV01_004276 [Terramyces sp. JEL0728]|nr:hypothetical protein HDV01_004470 [Terramyces sp. JEL0728]KAJ3273667.1 hypothetical protein HDV01_004276 [Terramyces sp. JEL0728]